MIRFDEIAEALHTAFELSKDRERVGVAISALAISRAIAARNPQFDRLAFLARALPDLKFEE